MSFPQTLDNFTNPTPSTPTNSPVTPLSGQLSQLNNAVEAIEGIIGVTGSTVPTSIEYRLADVQAVSSSAAGDIAAHEVAADPHAQYLQTANYVPARINSATNPLVSIQPTRVCTPVSVAGAAQYTSTLTGGAAISVDTENTDPLSGLGTAKLVMGGGDSSVQTVQFDSLGGGGVTPGASGIWLLPIWIDEDYAVTDGAVSIGLRLSHLTSPSGSNYRDYGWFSGSLHRGWNILMARNAETSIGASEYGVVGHMPASSGQVWTEGGGSTTSTSTYLSIRVRVYAPGRTIHVGGVYTAPANWAKAIICWGFDDCLDTVRTLALPVLESFGWRGSIVSTVQNATNFTSYMSMDSLRAAQRSGHDVISHTLSHYDMTTGTQAEKERQARETRKFWKANGFPTAADFGSFPFLTHDKTAMAVMAAAGYKAVRAGAGRFLSPAAPLCSLFDLPAASLETSNSWHADALLNGAIARRQILFAYMHAPIAGGAGSDTSPGSTQFYVDHLTRWCQLVKAKEQAGECEVMTFSQALLRLGLDL